ncbi:MAG: DUF3103 family protein, partial [Calditrichaeota bacterium]
KVKVAETRENIVNFGSLVLNTLTPEGKTIAQVIATSNLRFQKGQKRITLSEDRIREMVTQIEPMIDIYFPVPEHREKWLENKGELLVAYTPLTLDDTEWETITAYTLSGEKRLLDAKTPPEDPVLVISRCEHGGMHIIPNQPLPCPPDCGGGGGGGGNNDPSWRLKLTRLVMIHDKEPWAAGAPELYTMVKEGNAIGGDVEYDNDHGLLYLWTRNNWYNEFHDGEGTYSNLSLYLFSSYSHVDSDLRVEFWEDDGGLTFGDDLYNNQWDIDGGQQDTYFIIVDGFEREYIGDGDHNHENNVNVRLVYTYE